MKSKQLIMGILMITACFASMSSDIYAPAIPAISDALDTSIDNVQWSMAIFMLGVALSQLFYGPISEGIGRRPPLLFGLFITLAGTVICAFSPSITVLIAGRFIQGIGAGAGASLWRAIFRDTFTGDEATKFIAYMSIFVTFVIPASPTIGGYLSMYLGWRSIFVFLIAYSTLILFITSRSLQETHTDLHKDKLKIRFIVNSFKELGTSRIFMGYATCTFLCYGAFFSWYTVGPVLLIDHIGISPVDFGWISLLGGGTAMGLAGFINGKVVTKLGSHNMLRIGWALMIVAGTTMLGHKYIYGLNTVAIVAPMILFYFGSTFIWPSAFTGAFAPFGKLAGYAGALYSFMQIGGAAVLGSVVSYLPDIDQTPLACVFILAPLTAWTLFENIVKVVEEQ